MNRLLSLLLTALLILGLLSGCSIAYPSGASPPTAETSTPHTTQVSAQTGAQTQFDYDALPAYSGEPFVMVNGGTPFFELPYSQQEESDAVSGSASSKTTIESFETYSELDALGRCGPAYAAVGLDLMPTEERESISSVHPSGWNQAMYDNVDGNALYNRCHLLGYQLTAENANPLNLITGTRYMNTQGMLPFENMVADYVHETGDHVLYRVTPVFVGDELVARGVLMEAASMEDEGEGVLYCVFAYNVQPGIEIDYATGESRLQTQDGTQAGEETTYILNTGTKRFHLPGCPSVEQMNPERRQEYVGTREDLLSQGYTACGNCRP